jgi:hypothetical protein
MGVTACQDPHEAPGTQLGRTGRAGVEHTSAGRTGPEPSRVRTFGRYPDLSANSPASGPAPGRHLDVIGLVA